MTLFEIKGERYTYPDSWHDITATRYLEYLRDIEPSYPKEISDFSKAHTMLQEVEPDIEKWERKMGMTRARIMEAIHEGTAPKKCALTFPELYKQYTEARAITTDVESRTGVLWRANTYFPYLARVVSHFTGVPYEVCTNDMELGTLEFLASKVNAVFAQPPPDEQKSTYHIAGEVYSLPGDLMKKSTLIEFAEAAQFEQDLQSVRNGNATAMLNVTAVLLRPLGVAYSEEQYQRNMVTFAQHLTMHDLYQVAFFLRALSMRYALAFLTYTVEGQAVPGIGT